MKRYSLIFSFVLILSLWLTSCQSGPAKVTAQESTSANTTTSILPSEVATQSPASLSSLTSVTAVDMIEDATPDQVYLIQPEPFFIYSSTGDPFFDPSDRSLCIPLGTDAASFTSQNIYDFQIVTQKIFQGNTLKSFEVNYVNFDTDENNNVLVINRTSLFPTEGETLQTNYWFCRGDVPPIARDMAYQMKDKYPDATVKFAGYTITPKTETTKFILSFCFKTDNPEGSACPKDKNLDASHSLEDYLIYISASGLGNVDTDSSGMAIFEARIAPSDAQLFTDGLQIDQHNFFGGGGDGVPATITNIDGNVVNISIMP